MNSRLWALPHGPGRPGAPVPGAVEGRVYSVREINADAGLERALLADGAAADMAFLASHGSIQNLYCFSRLWEALEGRPVYFTSTMGGRAGRAASQVGAGAGPLRRAGQLLPGGEPGGSGGAGALRPQRPLRRGLSPQPSEPAPGAGGVHPGGLPAAGEGGGVPDTDGRRDPAGHRCADP